MEKEERTVCHDDTFHLEAYRFTGIAQPFPNHFHDYYVIGLVEGGTRWLTCRNKEYMITRGDIVLFSPGDNHGCTQSAGEAFDYKAVNIPAEVMRSLMGQKAEECNLPRFSQNVVRDDELKGYLRALHQMMMEGGETFAKEEALVLLVSRLTERYGRPAERPVSVCQEKIEAACLWMERRYAEHITLDELCQRSGLSKSTLLRAFTKAKGVTPYRYLQSVRIGKAKELLESGASPVEAATQTGFADQSHFSNFFHQYIGLPPAAYGRTFQEKRKSK